MKSYNKKPIYIDSLLLDIENPRNNPVSDQLEEISAIIKEQREKIIYLAKDIIKYGLNPSELIVVTKYENKYIVREGNRRITALKIINNPSLLDKINMDNNIKDKFKKLLKENKFDFSFNIDCVILDEYEEARIWIERKHTGENKGIGTVPWNASQQKRFNERDSKKISLTTQLIKHVKQSPNYNNELKEKIDSIKITNLERLISDPLVRETIGLRVKDGKLIKQYPDKEISRGITKILIDLLNPKFSVSQIYNKDKRIEYLATFSSDEKPNINIPLEETKVLMPEIDEDEFSVNENIKEINSANTKSDNNLDGNATSAPVEINTNKGVNIISNPKGNYRKSTDRKFLIPGSFNIKISNKRINDVYKELKKLDVNEFTNAAAVTFRVFLELSVDEYISENNIAGVNNDAKLSKKVEKCLEYLKANNLITDHEAKPINVAISSPNNILSINTFNSYVHNKGIFPSPTELKISWNNIEKFIEKLWD